MADKATPNPYANAKRGADFDTGIGDSLDKIAGQEVALLSYSISERSMRGEPRTFVEMQLDVNLDGEARTYHAWSDSLAEKLSRIPTTELPVILTFDRVATSGGFRVWTFS